jgi:hypothetical protein
MTKKAPAVVSDVSDSQWHLDKKVPIAVIVTILIQTGAIIWWAAGASERITALERQAAAAAPQSERLTRVETKLEAVTEGITEIKTILRAGSSVPHK